MEIIEDVFLIMLGEEKEETEMYICASVDEANSILEDESFGNATSGIIKIYQGVLVPANFIPNNLKACTPYIVIFRDGQVPTEIDIYNGEEIKTVYFEKVNRSNSIEVTDKIQELMEFNPLEKPTEYKKFRTKIENIRLFFGHQIQPVLNIAEINLDEELIHRVSNLALEMKNYNKEIEEGNVWQFQM